jgi:two-component system sensor histidine kinase CreC
VKLGGLLFLAFAAIVVACFAYPAVLVADRLRIVYLESAEEPLADTANVLAELVGRAMDRGALDVDALYDASGGVAARDVSARIYEIVKARVDLDVYITDSHGRVVFDSRGRGNIGADYSSWLDVSRTLAGKYGARISHNPNEPSMPGLLYVAAPIFVHGTRAGVLTVVKPTTAVRSFIAASRPRLIAVLALAALVAVALALLVSLWVSQQVGRLTRYAEHVRAGERVAFPRLADTELRKMGLAFERMRESLAGHAYIEHYVRALTHELKSPISAIRGAAEILQTPGLDESRRKQFLANVEHETQRIQDLADRMLELSELETRRALPERCKVLLAPLARTIVESHEPAKVQRNVAIALEVPADAAALGDAFLIHLALSNLVKNAVEFSPEAGRVRVSVTTEEGHVRIAVEDEGPGIPEFAKTRVFERFYSLARPHTGRKSTGLGLNLVKEIAMLHGGSVQLEDRAPAGLQACLVLPAG